MMRHLTTVVATTVIVVAAGHAHAADDLQRRQDEGIAATCAACHGTAGHAVPGATVPGLAGKPASSLTDQMLAFRSGLRPGTVMPQLARGYSDSQIERLARYFAAQPVAAAR